MTVKADVGTGRARPDSQCWQPTSCEAAGRAGAGAAADGVELAFNGEDEEQQEAQAFLGKAFGVALFLIAMILLAQFNSFFSAVLILTAVVMSTIGVLLGLLVTGQPFGIVMGGIGVIALAGIVVSNNIVLIDTFDQL